MKRLFLYPFAALTALSASAFAKAPSTDAAVDVLKPGDVDGLLAQRQLTDAVSKSLAIYPRGNDAFAFTLERAADGTLVAQHRSHYSHSSHSSHRSHYSSRY